MTTIWNSPKSLNRVLLKLSGEALAGDSGKLYDDDIIKQLSWQIVELKQHGIQVGIVIGGGNIWRGATNTQINRSKSDQLGMLSTVMNCIYVSEIFRADGLKTHILTPFDCGSMTELFSKDSAVKYLDSGDIVFFAGGTGHPFFSTDTGAVLRALEIEADAVLLAKNIDGVYDDDPRQNSQAQKFDTISLDDVIARDLKVMDLSATIMARDNKLPLQVFSLVEKDSIRKAALIVEGFNGTSVTV